MKLTAMFLFVACMQVSASGFSQITLSETNAPLQKVFKEIERQTGYEFLCPVNLLQKAGAVTVDLKNAPLTEAMQTILAGKGLDFTISDRTIVIRLKTPVNPDAAPAPPSPPVDIKIRVVDSLGAPLAGATITVKNSKLSGVTDAEGISTVKVNVGDIIVVSYVGYEPQSITIKGVSSTLTVFLKPSDSKLDEVQVVNKGYYYESKRLTTGTVSTVTAKDIERQPVSNPLLALQNRVPGLLVTQTSGITGSAVKVQLRGQNSIINGNDPLYIIDGVPYSSQNILGIGQGNPFDYLDPSNIETIDVLKDADATAIYGSRGANGVILITTKKGKPGRLNVNANFYEGVAQRTYHINFLSTPPYLQMRHEAFANDNASPGPGDYDLNGTWNSTRNTDWQQTLLGESAHYTNAELSLSGGSELVQYNIGGSYHNESAIFPGSFNNQKISIHTTTTGYSVNRKLSFQLSANYTNDNNHIPVYDPSLVINISPDAPSVYDTTGKLNWANSTWSNPLAYLLQTYLSKVDNLLSNATISYKLLKGFEFKTSFGYNLTNAEERNSFPKASKDPSSFNGGEGNANFSSNRFTSWIIEPQLNYSIITGDGKLEVLLGGTYQGRESNSSVVQVSGYNSDELLESISGGSTFLASSGSTEYKYCALFGRINYNWKNRYILNLTARRDGSSRFGPKNQFHNFGSAAFAWIFANEPVLRKSLSFLSFGKLRASVGSVGSDQIGDYKFLDLYSLNYYPYGESNGLFPSALFNPYLEWELTRKIEGGIDLGFFDNRLLLNVNYYLNRSGNQLINYQLPFTSGFNSIASNLPALVQNSGWEFSLSTVNFKRNDFTWKTNINLTISKNKLLEFPGLETSSYQSQFVIGQPLSVLRLYHGIGVDPASGVYKFLDKDGKPTFTPDALTDNYIISNTDPKFYGGIENNFEYKNFVLDIFLQFVNKKAINPAFQSFTAPGTLVNITEYMYKNTWKKPGDNALFEKLTQNPSSDAYQGYNYAKASDYVLINASYIRLGSAFFSYRFPARWSKKLHLRSSSIYFEGRDLFTITPFKGADPETLNYSYTPPLRVFAAGIRINL